MKGGRWWALLIVPWFILALVCMGKSSPLARPFLLPLMFLLYRFKDLFQQKLDRLSSSSPLVTKAAQAIFIALLAARLAQIAWRFHQPEKSFRGAEDIAIVNMKSIDLLFRDHLNPYSTPIDGYPVPTAAGGVKNYSGFKYPPLQLFLYAPAVLLGGLPGIFWTNLVAYLGILVLLYFLLLPWGKLRAYLGAIFFLAADFFFTLAFNKGINDFLPTLFLLLALGSLQKRKRGPQGELPSALFLCLSLLSKQLPGGMVVVLFLAQRKLRSTSWLLGAMLFLAVMVPFFLWSPQPFWENVVEFHLLRPVRETSILVYLPLFLQKVIPLLGMGAVVLFAFRGKDHPLFDLQAGWSCVTVTLVIFLMTAKMSPPHYFVWVLPFFILWTLTPSPAPYPGPPAAAET